MARAWITDRWTRSPIDPKTGERRDPKTKDHGHGSRWRVDWYEQQSDGTRKLRARSFRTKPLAEDYLAKVEHDIRSGTYRTGVDEARTVGATVRDWLASHHRAKPSTLAAYKQDLRVWIEPTWNARRLADVRALDVEQWLSALRDGTADRAYTKEFTTDRGGLGPSRVRRLHSILSGSFTYAVRHGWMLSNPAQGIELPAAQTTEQVFLSIDELEALADAAPTPSDRALIHLLGYVGPRIGEAVALRVRDLDLHARRATIRETATTDAEGRDTFGPPKTGKPRTVPLPRFLVDELQEITDGRDLESFVFRTPRGAGLNVHNWRARQWSTAVEGAGLGEIGLTPHKLRHTAASLAIASGADVKLVQRMLGHKDAAETLNTYAKLWPDSLDEVTERVEKKRRKALRKAHAGARHHD